MTGSELFSLLTCPHTTTFTLLSIFSPLEMSSIKIWEKLRSLLAKCSLPVAFRVSETRVLKLSFLGIRETPSCSMLVGSRLVERQDRVRGGYHNLHVLLAASGAPDLLFFHEYTTLHLNFTGPLGGEGRATQFVDGSAGRFK